MTSITKTRIIEANSNHIWDIMLDFKNIHYYNPYVDTVDLLTQTNSDIGATRVCHFYNGIKLKERIENIKENEEISIDILEGAPGVKKNRAIFRVKSLGENKTEVSMTIHYTPKYGILGRVMSGLMMKKLFSKTASNLLIGLDHYSRTGEKIGKGGKPIIANSTLDQKSSFTS